MQSFDKQSRFYIPHFCVWRDRDREGERDRERGTQGQTDADIEADRQTYTESERERERDGEWWPVSALISKNEDDIILINCKVTYQKLNKILQRRVYV